MRLDRRFVLALAAAACVCVLAGPGSAKEAPRARTGEEIRAALGPSGVSGWMAVDLDSGAVVEQGNAAHPFAPASVAKLPTAAYALDALGPEHRFETRVLAAGRCRAGGSRAS